MRPALIVIFLAAMTSGCTTLVTPPAALDPISVYIANYDRHASLLLPRGGHALAEYAFGEWEWYALGNNWLYRAPIVMLFPTRGTLGRHEWEFPDRPAPPEPDELAPILWAVEVIAIRVERDRASELLVSLDARFAREAAAQPPVVNYGLEFVVDDEDYWIFHQCNSAVAGWLRDLGCRVRGPTILSDFRVCPPLAVPAVPHGPADSAP
jgi:hypothetical protein